MTSVPGGCKPPPEPRPLVEILHEIEKTLSGFERGIVAHVIKWLAGEAALNRDIVGSLHFMAENRVQIWEHKQALYAAARKVEDA